MTKSNKTINEDVTSDPQALREELNAREKELKEARAELNDLREKMIHLEKMASLGEMTAGIAHEIKNPLNFVNNFSKVSRELIEDIEQDLSTEESINQKLEDIRADLADLKENISRIDEHGTRADSIVSNMLLQSRGERSEKTNTDINRLLDEYTDLAFHGMKAKNRSFSADVSKYFDSQVGAISVVPEDISRVFMNLITNGFQALQEHYNKSDAEGNPELRVATERSDDGIKIIIGDNGPGIPDEIRNKVLEPFFTTKKSGEGTGLGLSMSNEIIREHGGSIDINTRVGNGTEFQIFLPYSN